MLWVRFAHMAAGRKSVQVGYKSPEEKWLTCLNCLHAAPILLLRIWEAVWQRSISPLCPLRGCVTASIHHPDVGALIETAWLDLVSGWWHICHSTQWGVWASYHSSLSEIHRLKPYTSSVQLNSKNIYKMIALLYILQCFMDDLISGKTQTFRLRHWYCLGVPFDTTSPAPPGGSGGRKNVEGGSKFPPGRLLDGEAERRTDDNGREAGAWVSPQGDVDPATCWLRPLR